ncbi:MAG: cation-transporting P-type ATPase [Candidatus Thorarchaeota archaeon]|nr:cation-transporting P-type ATPase [Candidatus Thorarchaeota archaeon]
MAQQKMTQDEGNNLEHVPSMDLTAVLGSLSVDWKEGLSSEQVKKRQSNYGPNAIPKVKGSFWKVYIAPLLNWLINIYIVSSIALIFLAYAFPSDENQLAQAVVWLSVVFVNCLVAVFQQFRAQKKLEALEKLSVGDARVRRNGQELTIPPDEIVPGDILIIEQGDKIPADGRIIQSSNFSTNEASLTGESVPVEKDEDAEVESNAPIPEMKNMVFFGTYAATGTAEAITTTIGANTQIGKIQGTLEELNTGDIPLRRKVNKLAKYLGMAAIALLSISFFWQVLIKPLVGGRELLLTLTAIADELTEGITKAMTIMPINIPLLTTIVLLTGVLAMAKKGVIIRDLSAVESLGRVSVICSDKTGTMTKNQMTVKLCWDTESFYSISGTGYEPEGTIYSVVGKPELGDSDSIVSSEIEDVRNHPNLQKLLLCAGLNNDAELVKKEIVEGETVWTPIGDPTDAALLALFRKTNLDELEIKGEYETIAEYPFDSQLKRMSKVFEIDGQLISFVKGASEIILPRCNKLGGDTSQKMKKKNISEIEELTHDYASRGYRVISLAYRELDSLPDDEEKGRIKAENDLIYLGFACIVDPPREGVRDAIAQCHSAGINVVMITGDSIETAKTIASELGIHNENSLAVEGKDIPELSNEDFSKTNVFARVDPEHKQVIVERYQDQDKVVAMTGDGVNDSLALAMSDAGIAMGITGTDVAKEAADLVITDDSFPSIVTGVHEGRGLFNKIRFMIYFYIAINLFESVLFFGALFVLPEGIIILAVWQSLYLVVTTHSFPGLALVFDKTSPKAMTEEPRDSQDIITKPLAKYMALNVALMVIGAAIVYALTFTGWGGIVGIYSENLTGAYPTLMPFHEELTIQAAKATVMMMTVILIVESMLALIIRRINMPLAESIREPGIERFAVLLGLIYLGHLILMYVPLAQVILGSIGLHFYFVPLTIYDWLICILFSLPVILGMEIYKWYLNRKGLTL